MPTGPGKYDDLATYVREKTHAHVVLVAVIGGNKGTGFAVQMRQDSGVYLPNVLRTIADEIEASI